MKKIKILDLFAGTQSVKKSLDTKNGKYDYIGIDIYQPDGNNNIIFDLSQNNIIEKLKEKLPKNWIPDIIWASPLCTTFSRAQCIPGGTLSYELTEDKKIKIRTKFDHITHKNYVKFINVIEWQLEQQNKGRLGLKLMDNTIKIIKHFNKPFAIENPAYALSTYILQPLFIKNVTAYCEYGFLYKKPTAIYSNLKLNLNKCSHKKHLQVMSGNKRNGQLGSAPSSNKDRSKVPPKLISEIFEQLELHQNMMESCRLMMEDAKLKNVEEKKFDKMLKRLNNDI